MKRIYLVLFLVASTNLFCQNKLVEYEYWFNNDYGNVQTMPITPVANHQLNTNIDASSLNDGINVFNFRYKDQNNIYSSTVSYVFYKNIEQYTANKNLVEYEYWFNNDYGNVQVVPISPTANHQLNTGIDASLLSEGVNIFNIRYKDQTNIYSSTVSHVFYKNTEQLTVNNNLIEYEYWFNNDYGNVQVVSISPTANHQLNTNINTSLLNDGVNVFNLRYKDQNNIYSSTISQVFVKESTFINNPKIVGFKYWIDNDHNNAIYTLLGVPVQQLMLNNSIDLTQISKGVHAIHFQLLDSVGKWSLVTSDTITKTSFPISNFSYVLNPNCDSTIVTFTNNSVDGDSYLWDFDDGTYDSIVNPIHTFYSPGTYFVSLTVNDTLTLQDSTISYPINIIGETNDSIVLAECYKYVSPSGNFTYINSGIYKDTIPNSYGCDSIITINLTINTVDTSITTSVNNLSSNATSASYQWLDCDNNMLAISGEVNQNFSPVNSGNYAVEINQNGCVDTSACYQVTLVGINENLQYDVVNLFPNPTNDIINIKFNTLQKNITVRLNSISGQTIEYVSITNTNKFVLDLSDNPNGIYFIELFVEDEYLSTHKIIKN